MFVELFTGYCSQAALELLDCNYADEHARSLAVARLDDLSNADLQSYLLQLVQVGSSWVFCKETVFTCL